MTINRILTTPIVMKAYNSRAITNNGFVCKNCKMMPNGDLYVLLPSFSVGRVRIYKSDDNGFSWTVAADAVWTGTQRENAGLVADGFIGHLVIDEHWRNLDYYLGEIAGGNGSVERLRYDLDDLASNPDAATVLTTTDNPLEAMFDVSYNHESTFIVWTKTSDGDLYVTKASPRTSSVSSDLALSSSALTGLLSSVCSDQGKVHIVFLRINGGFEELKFVTYDSTTPSFGSIVEITQVLTATRSQKDLAIALDGLGNILVIWTEILTGTSVTTIKYDISLDSGVTWEGQTALTKTSGFSSFVDSITSDAAGRTNVIAGSKGGFLITYVDQDTTGTPRTFVRAVTTSDSGASYDLGDEKEIAQNSPFTGLSIVGAQWFNPVDVKLIDIGDPTKIRVAFTSGEGDSTIMADTIPVAIGQELLGESAFFPSSLISEASSYTFDSEVSGSIIVDLSLFAGPSSNDDYFSLGLTGSFTDKYTSAFQQLGTYCRLLRFEPDADNFLDDISAYSAPTETEVQMLFDPVTYSFPSPALTAADTKDRIEQDVRKLHLPPNQHLERTFLVNKGGFLKRTVWVVEYDGNQYEISQVIPRFINNEICFYECNAYVMGPSRNPFSRIVLPSET